MKNELTVTFKSTLGQVLLLELNYIHQAEWASQLNGYLLGPKTLELNQFYYIVEVKTSRVYRFCKFYTK